VQVSLDASGEHAIANTPTPATHATGANVPSALHGQGSASHDSVHSTHGGHVGKLQESLTKSAAMQLPPTPTPTGQHVWAGPQLAAPPASIPGGSAELLNKSKHGRLGMLSASLNASAGLQLPPTPTPAGGGAGAGGMQQAGEQMLGVGGDKGAVAAEKRSEARDERAPAAAVTGQQGGSNSSAYLSCVRAVLDGNTRKAAIDCVGLVVKYFDNVLRSPHNEKYRRIPVANNAFRTRVASCVGSKELLLAAGWRESAGAWQLPGDFNRVQLSLASDGLRDVLQAQVSRDACLRRCSCTSLAACTVLLHVPCRHEACRYVSAAAHAAAHHTPCCADSCRII